MSTPTTNSYQGQMANGQPYQPHTKTGILWRPPLAQAATYGQPGAGAIPASTPTTATVSLWDKGVKLAEASPLKARTAYEFWHSLEFMEVFPQITHWWFGSVWTGQVRLSQPVALLEDANAKGVMGFMQFVDEQTESLPWSIADTTPVEVFVSLPPLFSNPANFPLRLRLAELVLGLVPGDTLADQWYFVTSLVTPAQLQSLLYPVLAPATELALTAATIPGAGPTSSSVSTGVGWALEGHTEALPSTFCALLGLKEPHVVG
jgi:hypothetical protein